MGSIDGWGTKIPLAAQSSQKIKNIPRDSDGEESACNTGDLGSIPGLGGSPGEGKGYSLQYSGLENSMDSIVHRIAKSQTCLNDFKSKKKSQYQT